METYQTANQLNPNSLTTHYGLGQIYAKKEDFSSAISEYQEAVRIQADHSDTRYKLAQLYIKTGEAEKAKIEMAFFQTLRQTDPLLAKAQTWVMANPEAPEGYNNLGIVYATRQRYDLAIQNYKQATKLSPSLATAYYNLGLIYGKTSQQQLAIESYKQAITHQPRLAIAHNNLAVSYAKQEATFASALKHAKIAVKLAPEEANYYDTLALAYYKSQMYSEAEEAVRKAIELEPQNQSHLDRLTQILHSRGNQ